ncbi:MAG: ArsR/SmtB family transcription factor [Thermoleophilia bacterium]
MIKAANQTVTICTNGDSCNECCPPAEDTRSAIESLPLDEAARDQELSRLARALGHPARVAIVRLLQQRGSCIAGDISAALPLAQSTVSEHLRLLKEAGFIRGQIAGPRTCYCVDAVTVARFKLLVEVLGDGNDEQCDAGSAPVDGAEIQVV